MQLRIVSDSLAECRQGILVFHPHQYRRVTVTLSRARERVDIHPDLRFKRLARRVKQTDNRVIRRLNAEAVADVQSLKPFGNSLRDNCFCQAGLKKLARDSSKT